MRQHIHRSDKETADDHHARHLHENIALVLSQDVLTWCEKVHIALDETEYGPKTTGSYMLRRLC
jgi:hypothetical protein